MTVFAWMRKICGALVAHGAERGPPAQSSRSTAPRRDVAARQPPAASGLGFMPQRAPGHAGDAVFPEPGRAADTVTDTAFARECGLDAVFRWYLWFLEADTADGSPHHGEERSDPDGALGANRLRRQGHDAIPGFPLASYQVVETQEHGWRVRFYDRNGRALGVLDLNPQGDSCTIDVEGGQRYLIREVSKVDLLNSAQEAV